jgi:hypothetical protein
MYKNVQLTNSEIKLLREFLHANLANFDQSESINLHILLRLFTRYCTNEK